MPGPPRTYPTNAARQRAYRERCRRAAASTSGAPGKPARPPVAPQPGRARWRGLLQQAHHLLDTAHAEMESYYEQRSARWRDGDAGETFLERLEAVHEAREAVNQVDL